MQSIAIFGGTFDPVHEGHIQTSLAIQAQFHFDDYYFLPCKTPVIKAATIAGNQDRVAMLKLALKNHPEFKIDLREIHRDTPSYMVDTLRSFRDDYKNASITLILGYDAFLSLPQWHEWQEIITLANLLVMNREHYSQDAIPDSLRMVIEQQKNAAALLLNKAGVVCFFDAGDYDISSSEVRERLRGQYPIKGMLVEEVGEYILQKGLYQ